MEAQQKRTGRPRFRVRRHPAAISVQVRAGRLVAGVPYRIHYRFLTPFGGLREETIDGTWNGLVQPSYPYRIGALRIVDHRGDWHQPKAEEIRSLRRLDREPWGLTDFVGAYVACALWSSLDEDGEPFDDQFDAGDIDSRTLRRMTDDCRAFLRANRRHIRPDDIERAGRDFWLTRSGAGSGFWDGDWDEPAATILTDAAHSFGSFDLIVGDDGRIHGL